MSDGSWPYRIAGTGRFRYWPLHQTQIACWSHESHEIRTSRGDGRVLVV